MNTRIQSIADKPNFWIPGQPTIKGSDITNSLCEIRCLYTSSLESYSKLSSKSLSKNIERMGTVVGLDFLESVVLRQLESEEEKAKHRVAGDEYMSHIDEIVCGKCSPALLKRECLKIFSDLDQVTQSDLFASSRVYDLTLCNFRVLER